MFLCSKDGSDAAISMFLCTSMTPCTTNIYMFVYQHIYVFVYLHITLLQNNWLLSPFPWPVSLQFMSIGTQATEPYVPLRLPTVYDDNASSGKRIRTRQQRWWTVPVTRKSRAGDSTTSSLSVCILVRSFSGTFIGPIVYLYICVLRRLFSVRQHLTFQLDISPLYSFQIRMSMSFPQKWHGMCPFGYLHWINKLVQWIDSVVRRPAHGRQQSRQTEYTTTELLTLKHLRRQGCIPPSGLGSFIIATAQLP